MYLLEPGFSLGPGPDFLILEASRQPQLVPKPERMTSDGGKSKVVGRVLGDSNLTLYLGMSTLD